jgi:Tol biopolymer transport system component
MFKKMLFLFALLLPALTVNLFAALDPVDTVWSFRSENGIKSFTVSPDGRYVAVLTNGFNGKNFKPTIYDAESGTFTKELEGWVSMTYTGACFSPDSRYLAVCGLDDCVNIWDVDSNIIFKKIIYEPYANYTSNVSFSPTGDTIVFCSRSHVILMDFNTGELISDALKLGQPDKIVYSPRGDKILVLPPHSDKYYLIDLDSMNWYKTIKFVNIGEFDEIYGVSFSPDGTKIVSNHTDGLVYIINSDDTSLVNRISFYWYLKNCGPVFFTNRENYLISRLTNNDTSNILIFNYSDSTVYKRYNLDGDDLQISGDDLYLYLHFGPFLTKIMLDWTQGIFYNGGTGNEQTVKPNPISNKGILSLTALTSEPCEIDIYEPGGRHIRKLYSGMPDSDSMELEFDASGMTKGVYFCTIKSKSSNKTVKFIVE